MKTVDCWYGYAEASKQLMHVTHSYVFYLSDQQKRGIHLFSHNLGTKKQVCVLSVSSQHKLHHGCFHI